LLSNIDTVKKKTRNPFHNASRILREQIRLFNEMVTRKDENHLALVINSGTASFF
jgi:hypothetical protein